MNEDFFLANLWRWKCGLPEKEPDKDVSIDLESLKRSEWSPEFERLMRNRLLMGAIRYGKIKQANRPNYDRVGSALKRLEIYKATGNLELLVDAANLCLIEFETSSHPNKHFEAIDDGEHVQIIK